MEVVIFTGSFISDHPRASMCIHLKHLYTPIFWGWKTTNAPNKNYSQTDKKKWILSRLTHLKHIYLWNDERLHDRGSEHGNLWYIGVKTQFSAKINFYFFYRKPHMLWWSDLQDCVLLNIFYVTKCQIN